MPKRDAIRDDLPESLRASTFGSRRRRREEAGQVETPPRPRGVTMVGPAMVTRIASLRVGDETFSFND